MMTDAFSSWPVVGHRWAIRQLAPALRTDAAAHGGPHHAYLFLGPRQIGKSTFARAFAQGLLCTASEGRPCGHCRSCQLMTRGGHPDFRLVSPVDKDGSVDRLDGSLRSEQAGAVVHEVALRPMEGRYRVFLLQDVHLAQPAFANKLLKTLEEPPPQVVLLLTAVDRSSVLPTIVSRCQNLELRPLDLPTLEEALRTIWGSAVEQAQLLARLSNGRLGWAVEQLQQPERSEQRRDQLHTLWRMMAADRIERLAFAETLAANRNSRQLFGMLELWVSWWRDLLLVQSGCADACSNIDHQAEIERQARLLDNAAVKDFLRTLQRSEEYLHHTVNTRLAVDVLMLKLPVMTTQAVVT